MAAAWAGYRQGKGGFYRESDGSGPYSIDSAGTATLLGSSNTAASVVGPANAASTSVASAATSTVLIAANASRKGAALFNESTSALYLKLGSSASVTSYTVQVVANGYYEVPFGYTGVITGIWATANGNARITELS
jgi:hypothetical protein